MNPVFWKGKRVLVTGHTGFKGSWLTLWLQSMGAQVIGYALKPPTTNSLFEEAGVSSDITNIIGDIRDLPTLLATFTKHQPEVVFHMAAQALVRHSYNDPVETYSTNVMGTVNVFEAVRRSDCVKAVVIVTSDKCYENKEWEWGYRENEPMGGYDPYSSSKGCSELVTASYRRSFFNIEEYEQHGVAVASARAGNVIGGGDWAEDRLIPDIMKAIMRGEQIIIRNPDAIRPWQHVLEPLSGYLLLAQKLYEEGTEYTGAWNFGPSDNDAKSVQWIVNKLTQNWSGHANWKLDENKNPHEAHYLKLDCSKAKSRLDWKPNWNLEIALQMIIEWYSTFHEGGDMRALTLQQIATYTLEQNNAMQER